MPGVAAGMVADMVASVMHVPPATPADGEDTAVGTVPAVAAPAAPGLASRAVFYRHYKGGLYEWLYEATLESDLSVMVVYRAADGSVWLRPRAVFHETVDVDGVPRPRFARID